MQPGLVLFDIDGTLLITGGASSRCMLLAGQSVFGPNFHWSDVTVGTTDPLLLAELARANGIADYSPHHPANRDAYLRLLDIELAAHADRIKWMPGFPQLLEQLQQRRSDRHDVLVGLLTGNYQKAAELKFRYARMMTDDLFDIAVYGEDAADRPGLVPVALERYRQLTGYAADRRRVVIVGDTPRDVQCAHAGGCQALAVATGRFTIEQLRLDQPDRVVSDLADPTPLLELLKLPADP